MKEQKYSAIDNLSQEDKYTRFLADVAKAERVWIIERSRGSYMLRDADKQLSMPLWSEPDLVEYYIETNNIEGARAEAVDIVVFLTEWIDFAVDNNLRFTPLPSLTHMGATIAPYDLQRDIQFEMDKEADEN
ncbi:MAG TPA: DUF2750 domain-containing protein [Flavihumibacter sp.]|jgi:hypothetical protein